MSKKFYITTPIYYVNDKPHIGSAYTTIAADVLARYYRQQDYDVFFLTGTDEHGDKVAESAEKKGIKVQEFVDQNAGEFQQAFQKLNITYDIFMRTTDPAHKKSVDVFMNKLKSADALYQDEYEGLYCKGCEDFLLDKDLDDGKCPIHNVEPEKLKEKNWFFKLDKYIPIVKRLIQEGGIKIEPEARKNEVLGMIDNIPNFSVTREKVNWGLEFAPDPSQKVYVWIEALQNYISALGYGQAKSEFHKYWPADIHLMAKDIIKFHAIHWPAMLIAVGEEPPKEIYAHGFFSLDGKKMSKSLGNVIDPNDLVKEFGVDATRYLLLTQFPFGQDGDIKRSLFKEKYNADLANNLGNLVSRVLNMIERYMDGEIPKKVESPIYLDPVGEKIENLKFDEALKELWQAIAKANQIIDENEPWNMAKDPEKLNALGDLLSDLASFLYDLAANIRPFMPHTADKIIGSLSAKKVVKGEPLFKRL